MSLKAKLEAVIYAAEEPVTLTQLAALFAADALEWKAQQEAAAAEQTAEVAGVAPDAAQPLPLLAEGLEYLGLADSPAVYASGDLPPAPETHSEPAAVPTPVAEKAPPPPPPSESVVSISQEEAYPSIVVNEPAPS